MDCTFPNPTSNEKDQKPVDEAPFMNSKVVWAQQVPKHMSLQDKVGGAPAPACAPIDDRRVA